MLQLGDLSFIVERFQTWVVSEQGKRTRMEDRYIIQHDLGLDQAVKASFFSVIDGHGGEWCAKYLCEEMIQDMTEILQKQIFEYQGNLAEMPVSNLIKRTF